MRRPDDYEHMGSFLRPLKWVLLAHGRDIRNPFHAALLVGVRIGLALLLVAAFGGYSSEEWRAIPIVVALFAGFAFVLFAIPPVRRWMKRKYMGVDEDAAG